MINYKENDIYEISKIVYKYTGIQLGIEKKILIENRFNKLINSIKEIEKKENIKEMLKEIELNYIEKLINSFTTNKTNFFREVKQFEYLYNEILPNLFNNGISANIYCSASSTGEEPWSIAATCEAASNKSSYKYVNYSILATDIDTDILKVAKNGIYNCSDLKKQYFPYWIPANKVFVENVKKCNQIENIDSQLTINENLRKHVMFKQLNLIDNKYDLIMDEYYNIIFCRNVLIYFSKEDQFRILEKLIKKLKHNGYLFLGHSETVDIKHFNLERLHYNIFRKK